MSIYGASKVQKEPIGTIFPQKPKSYMAKEATKSFVLRIDAEMMEAIEKWAEDEFRSTNGQLQYIIAEALRKSGRIKKKKKE
jgi:hypothetical protein